MKTTHLNSTQPDAMDALVLAVARAAALCPPSLQKTLLEACDAVEAEHDALKAGIENAAAILARRLATIDELKAERDALKVERHDFKFMFDDLYKEHKALKAERDALKPSTVTEEIITWAVANYDKSHAAQTVVEGCWDAGELEAEFDSLQAFIEYAGVRDDYREDIISMGGE